jgi:hypothetical protein
MKNTPFSLTVTGYEKEPLTVTDEQFFGRKIALWGSRPNIGLQEHHVGSSRISPEFRRSLALCFEDFERNRQKRHIFFHANRR